MCQKSEISLCGDVYWSVRHIEVFSPTLKKKIIPHIYFKIFCYISHQFSLAKVVQLTSL